jgi:hypothetical protein
MMKSLVQGASDEQQAEVRISSECRKAYDSVANVDRQQAKPFCAGTLPESP